MLTDYQKFIALSRYARWLPNKRRRETWDETVERYISFIRQHLFDNHGYRFANGEASRVSDAILNLSVMPSMRAMMAAGPALSRDNVAGFNCSYVTMDSPQAFSEIIYILMCGSGVGFSVERQVICDLPEVPASITKCDTVITVEDNRIGWSESYQHLINHLYQGVEPKWDLSLVRPAGAPLKTFGGRASGPAPLEDLFNFTVSIFHNARGRKLSSIEIHDIVCKIGDIVVVGGVRRSALISLSNLSDDRMRHAKSGDWWKDHPHRALANNSAAYTERPEIGRFMYEWTSLYESRSGERGFFNRVAAAKQVEKLNGRREQRSDFGCNPCSEIILRPNQFCNLSEVIIRPEDTEEDLKQKVEIATILGTFQASLTKFRYLRSVWQKNTQEEALLGVSLTGILDNALTNGIDDPKATATMLQRLRAHAVTVNQQWAATIGIRPAAAITCVKPSGTVSQLCDTASGIHPRYAPYYIRRVRMDKKDPVAHYMRERGFVVEDEIMHPNNTDVFSFPVASPKGALVGDNLTAIQHLEIWKLYQDHWCEHKPSATITVREDEWLDVGAWVYRNFNSVSGISFLPHSGHIYKQAPYEEIDEKLYNKLLAEVPTDSEWKIDEGIDTTSASQELACVAGACEL